MACIAADAATAESIRLVGIASQSANHSRSHRSGSVQCSHGVPNNSSVVKTVLVAMPNDSSLRHVGKLSLCETFDAGLYFDALKALHDMFREHFRHPGQFVLFHECHFCVGQMG